MIDEIEYKQAIIYCRVSSERQKKEGHGLDSQEHRCRDYAHTKGYQVVEVFKDSFSGGGDFMQRPAMSALLNFVDKKAHEPFVVIFDDLSRFARDVNAHFRLRQAFDDRKIKIECPNFTFENTPEGELVETMMAAQHQYHRKNNRRQVIQKQKARLEAGYWAFGSKRGYQMVKDAVHGKISVPKEPDATLIRKAVEGYSIGEFQTKTDACEFLVKKGFWKKQSPEKYISKFTDMIDSPFIAGYVEYLEWDVSIRKGQHEGIVSLDVLRVAQKRSNNENLGKRPRIDKSEDFPLRGLIKCSGCDGHITAYRSKGNGGGYIFYECKNKNCPLEESTLRKEDVEGQFNELLKEIAIRDEVIKFLEHLFEQVWEKEIADLKSGEVFRLRQEELLKEKVNKLTDAVIGAKSDALRKVYEKQLEETAEELDELKSKTFSSEDLKIPYRTALKKSTGLLKSPYKIWNSVDVHEKQRLFYFLFDEKLSYSKKAGYRTDKLPCAVRLFEDFVTSNTQDVEMGRIELPSAHAEEETLHAVVWLLI